MLLSAPSGAGDPAGRRPQTAFVSTFAGFHKSPLDRSMSALMFADSYVTRERPPLAKAAEIVHSFQFAFQVSRESQNVEEDLRR